MWTRLSLVRARDERALALDPLDHALVLELGEGLSHDRPRDPVLRAHPMLAGEQIARDQTVARDHVDQQLPQLVVHGGRGAAIDGRGRG